MVNTLNGNVLPGVAAPAPCSEQDREGDSVGPPNWVWPTQYPNAFDIAVNTLAGATVPGVSGEVPAVRELCIPKTIYVDFGD
jgi:hypothetical protein